MMPIIAKDLVENSRVWLLFFMLAVLGALLVACPEVPASKKELLHGFFHALVLSSSLIFAHTVVFSERKGKHLLFLKSLPISDTQIIKAKFVSLLLLVLTLSNTPHAVSLFQRSQFQWVNVFLSNSLVVAYASTLLFLSICFKNPAFTILPLYLGAFVVLATDLSWFSEFLWTSDPRVISSAVAILSALLTLLLYRLALLAFRRKELEF
jgi:hypothetical protein